MWAVLSLVCLCSVAVKGGYPSLSWPEKYSYTIRKYTITSGMEQEMQFWKSDTLSRIDYNDGVVKQFQIGNKRRWRSRLYEIHPETYNAAAGEANEEVCHSLSAHSHSLSPLPDLEDLDMDIVDEERMNSKYCVKFVSDETEDVMKRHYVLWAEYDSSVKAYNPVRLEYTVYNNWRGMVETHEIWDFDNYDSTFDDKEVFELPEACSSVKLVKHDLNDEAVTKHLMFMDPIRKKHVDHVFNAFKKKYGANYEHLQEHAQRKSIFEKNMRRIHATNRKNLGYKLAVNHFADRTPEELQRYRNLKRRNPGDVGTDPFPYKEEQLQDAARNLPAEYDLREEGLVSPVINQGECGSCWTCGTTSAVEGALARYNGGNLIHLSNQALIDCGWEFHSDGCDGGTDTSAYQWMMKYGLPTIAEYGTYLAQDGYCKIESMNQTYPIRGYVDVTPNSVTATRVALFNNGPLSVSLDATDNFLSYSGGIFYDFECSQTSLNHEVTLVGYGEEYGEPFWIIKNSYGPEWGIGGFMHISAKDNNCGIMTEPTYVLF